MNLIINDTKEQADDFITVAELLKCKSLDAAKVVVEVNAQIVKRTMFDSYKLTDGDRVEILRFVGGG